MISFIHRFPLMSIISLVMIMTLATGCATSNRRTVPTSPTMTIYCLQGDLIRLDLGDSGPSHADLTTWWANVYSSFPKSGNASDASIIGIASGFNIVTSQNKKIEGKKDLEFRASTFNIELFESKDSIVFGGLYRNDEGTAQPTIQVRRPVLGGSGQFLGRDGECVVTPEGDNWFRVDFYLLD